MANLNEFRSSYLSAPDFWARAVDAVDALADSEVHCSPVRREVKTLVEEILPLALLVRFLDMPRRRVSCRYFGQDADSYDAMIRLSGKSVDLGFMGPSYAVEVTSAQFPKEHLRREALGLYGGVFCDPGIYAAGSKRRGNRRVVSQAQVRDGRAAVCEAKKWVQQAVSDKLGKRYADTCMLVVRVVPERLLSLAEWAEVAGVAVGATEQDAFEHIFLVDPTGGHVFHVS